MARSYEDLDDIDSMPDDDVRALLVQRLGETDGFDA